MGRGKIEIKMIANPTNRQVTYSKRRGGIKKKAEELTKLCDAEVFILMFSNTGKLFEYCSPSTDIKTIVDKYLQVTGIDVWKPQYEMMQKKLEHLQELNNKLRKEIGKRMGEELEVVDGKELRDLEHEMDVAIKVVRERKYHVINTQTETYKKKLRNSELAHRKMLHDLEGCGEVMDYNLYQQEATEYEAAPFAYRVHASQSNLQEMGFGYHDLRLG